MDWFKECVESTVVIVAHLVRDALICVAWYGTAVLITRAGDIAATYGHTHETVIDLAKTAFNYATFVLLVIYLCADIWKAIKKHLLV